MRANGGNLPGPPDGFDDCFWVCPTNDCYFLLMEVNI